MATLEEIRRARQLDALRAAREADRRANLPRPGETSEDYRARTAGIQQTEGSKAMDAQAEAAMREAGGDALLEENPALGPMASTVEGLPFIGSWVDEAFNALHPGAGDRLTMAQEAYRRENPGKALGYNVLGGVVGSLPAVAAAGPSMIRNAAPTVGGRVLQAMGLGAGLGGAEGAVYGAGEAEGKGRTGNALWGAGAGSVIGLATGAAAPYAEAGIRSVARGFRDGAQRTIQRELGASPAAARVIKNAVDAGDQTTALQNIRRGGEDAMLADANQSTRQILDTAAQSPGDAGTVARDAVRDRVQGAIDDMNKALDDAFGLPRGEQEIIAEIRQTSSPARKAAYDAAYATPIDYSADAGRRIESLLPRIPESAINRANALMKVKGEESAQILISIGENGRVSFTRMPDVRQIDYITRALRDVAAETDGAGRLGGKTDLGTSYDRLAVELRNATKTAVPQYSTALETAADAIGQKNAVEVGYDLLRSSTRREDIAAALHGATGPERAAMGQGVRSFVDDLTADVARTITDPDTNTREGIAILRSFSSRSNATKLRMLLGGEQADALLAKIDEAATGFELRAAIAENSKTAVRQSVQGSVNAQTEGGIVRTLAAGEPINASKRLVQALTGETAEAREIRKMGLYKELADILVNTRGVRAERALRLIQDAINGQALTDARASYVATVVTGALAGGGAPTASREASRAMR